MVIHIIRVGNGKCIGEVLHCAIECRRGCQKPPHIIRVFVNEELHLQVFTKTFPELFQLSMWIEEHKVKPNGSDDVLSIVDGHIGCRLRVPRVEQKIEVISSQEGSQFHSGGD